MDEKDQEVPERVRWEGDSREQMHKWPKPPKANIGGDLTRLQKGEEPLDFDHLGDGIYELRDQQQNVWYRLLYWLNSGWVYVLHCFKKKTNQTPQAAIDKAKTRKRAVLDRKDEPFVAPIPDEQEEESA